MTGVFSGRPTAAGAFTFTVDASDTSGASVSKTYTVTIPAAGVPAQSTIATSASPVAGGSTSGGGTFDDGTPVTVVATHSPGYAFVNWTEGGLEVSNSAVYPFTVNGDRSLVANFVPSYTITTSASPSAGGSTSGGGVFIGGASVTVQASANATYHFVSWTEGAAVVSSSASYPFTVSTDRSLVANFALNPPELQISSATAARNGSKVDVTVTIGNSGGLSAPAVTIGGKKDATIDGKATNEHPPILLGDIAPAGGTATAILTFAGVKSGLRTLKLTMTYTGGTVTLTTQVSVP